MKVPAGSPPGTARQDDKDSASAFQPIAYESAPARDQTAEISSEPELDRAMLSAVLDALPVGVIIADSHGKIIRHNSASRQLWGTPADTTNWEGFSDWVGYWPDSGERLKAEGTLDAYLVPNPPVALRIAYFVGGYALIALGVFLLVFAIMNVAAVSLF